MFTGFSTDFKKGAYVTVGVVVALLLLGMLMGLIKK